jgi:hypothetical protein
MAKRHRKLQSIDFEKRALARYANACFVVGDSLSTSFEEFPDGRRIAVVRNYGLAICCFEVNKGRLRKIDLPLEFW